MRNFVIIFLLGFLIFSNVILAGSGNISSDSNRAASASVGYVGNQIVIKFAESTEIGDLRRGDDGYTRTDIPSLDKIAVEYAVTNMVPQFPGAKPILYNGQIIDLSRDYIVTFESGVEPQTILNAYRQDENIEKAQPIGITEFDVIPNDPQYINQKHLNQDNDHDIDAPEAWDCEDGSSSVILAILDAGIRYYHKDLGGADASYANPGASRGNMWINWEEKNGSAGVDDDNNGYVDDWIGWDFGSGDNDPIDTDGHGTHCAGIAAAGTNDGYGTSGVAGGWNSGALSVEGSGIKIMALRIGTPQPNMAAAAQAFYYAANNGAKIASCSWLSDNTGNLDDGLDYFLASGGIVFKSAGNYNTQEADYINGRTDTAIVSVAAVDSLDRKADFSNYGIWVDVSAPGTGILSTCHGVLTPEPDVWSVKSGTSMASPMAAAVAALIWSRWPEWTQNQVVDSLKLASTDNINMYLELIHQRKMGIGRVNASKKVCSNGDPHQWSKTFSNNSSDVAIDICSTPDGGYVSLVNGFEIVDNDSGNYQIYLQKMNSYGHLEWSKSFMYGSSTRLFGRQFISTSDGGYLIVGGREQSANNWDICVIKTGPTGEQVWNRTFGGAQEQQGFDAVETTGGDFLIVGTGGNFVSNDVLILKIDGSDGDSLWTGLYGRSGSAAYEEGRKILADQSGEYVIMASAADTAIFVLWLNVNGDTTRTAIYTESGKHISARDMTLSSDHGCIIAASSRPVPPGDFDCDILLLKLNSSGGKCWSGAFGELYYDESDPSVIKTLDSGFIVAGYTNAPSANGKDLYLVKTNACGLLHWEQVINESIDEYSTGIIQTSDKGYFICGSRLASGETYEHSYFVKIPEQPAYICGDINGDSLINILDTVYLINFKYKGGPAPVPLNKGNVNCDGFIDILDIVHLINYTDKGGPAPCPCH